MLTEPIELPDHPAFTELLDDIEEQVHTVGTFGAACFVEGALSHVHTLIEDAQANPNVEAAFEKTGLTLDEIKNLERYLAQRFVELYRSH